MKILAIHVGQPREVRDGERTVTTSIFKQRVAGKVGVGLLNIEGDRQSDPRFHGGRDKAVYAYPADHGDWWRAQWDGRDPEPAQFGENLSLAGGTERDVVIGDRYRSGELELEVTQPRVPCYKLGIRTGDPDLTRFFWDSGRLGWYMRVEQEGEIEAGDVLRRVSRPDHGITVHELWRCVVERDAERARQALDCLARLDDGWVRRLRALLA